jgi:hypothetical protein
LAAALIDLAGDPARTALRRVGGSSRKHVADGAKRMLRELAAPPAEELRLRVL